jgi:hypothetical protein
MIKALLYRVDNLIHKVIPHPPCEKLHMPPFNYSTTTSSTANLGHVTWTYTK